MSNILHRGKWTQLVEDDGWEYCQRIKGHSAVVIPNVTVNNTCIFVEQYRKPLQNKCIEWPAGLVGDEDTTETILDAAEKELFEETGYKAKTLKPIKFPFASSAGAIDERVHFVIARGCYLVGSGGGLEEENIVTHEVELENINQWINIKMADGIDIGAKVFAGFYLLNYF